MSGSIIGGLQAAPPAETPGLRNPVNRFDVWYTLFAPARVAASIRGVQGGQTWVLHGTEDRPTAGQYRVAFDGTVPGPGPQERRALPDGDYRITLVVQAAGVSQRQSVVVSIHGADPTPPTIQGLTLTPDHITPNYDARNDVTLATYQLAKAAGVQAFADRVAPDGSRQRVWTGKLQKAKAGEQLVRWDAVVGDQPVANGTYDFGIRAQDTAGNVSVATQPLTVSESGTPSASIIWAQIAPRQVIRGGTLCADVTVRNTGQTVLRTQGPDPGYVYNSFDSYSSIANHQYAEHAGFWRVGLDWAPSPDTTGAKYPYRWGLGHDLQPGQEVTVHGCVKVANELSKMVFFAGLIQENVAIHDNGVGLVPVTLTP